MELLWAFSILATWAASVAVQPFTLSPSYLNNRLPDSVDSTHEGLSLAKCAQKCRRVPVCLSINYQKSTQTCDLNRVTSSTGNPKPLDGWIVSDISDWPQDIAGNCGSNPCLSSQECVPSDSGPLCFTGCGPPSTVVNATAAIVPLTRVFGSTAEYQCNGGTSLVDPTSDMTLTCLGSGKWTTPQFQCA